MKPNGNTDSRGVSPMALRAWLMPADQEQPALTSTAPNTLFANTQTFGSGLYRFKWAAREPAVQVSMWVLPHQNAV